MSLNIKRTDFPKKKNQTDDYYDPEYDAILIEQSIAKQYHILPSMQGDLSYCDWAKLVSGLMNDTPLGKIVEIRSEDDSDIIKNMSAEQLAIRNEWHEFKVSQTVYSKEEMKKQSDMLERMMASLFG